MCLAWEVGGAGVQGPEDRVAATMSVELFGLLLCLCFAILCAFTSVLVPHGTVV